MKLYFKTEAFVYLTEEINKLRLTRTYKCSKCTHDISDTRFVKCTSCFSCFHLSCYDYQRAPPKKKHGFVKLASRLLNLQII